MKKIFISYANRNMAYSLKRIGQQARRLGIFDEVILWTPDQLPDYVLASSLIDYKRGAGYWVWKPAIILETLKQFGNDAIVVYADAGCSLNASEDWETYFKLLADYETLCFEYQDEIAAWANFGQTSTKIKYWTKQQTLDYFKTLTGDENYPEKYNKIMGGFLFCRNEDNVFINKWMEIMLERPELVIDPESNEKLEGNQDLAYHKHDQSIITPLAHLYSDRVKLLEATMETATTGAVVASRVRAKNYRAYCWLMFKDKLRELLGKDLYNNWKAKYKKIGI